MVYYLSALGFVLRIRAVVVTRFQSIRGASNYHIEKITRRSSILHLTPDFSVNIYEKSIGNGLNETVGSLVKSLQHEA